jgi:hypothetical protein
MPYSSDILDPEICAWLAAHPADRYLDVGAGAGKYGRILRTLFGPAPHLTAMEPDASYHGRFALAEIYDVVDGREADALVDAEPDFTTGICILGDVIEHMRKSAGLDLLNYLVYRCRWTLVVYPTRYVQGAWEGHKLEAHRSAWCREDFDALDVDDFRERGGITMVVIRGYI